MTISIVIPMFDRARAMADDLRAWRYVHAVLLANAAQTTSALAVLDALLAELNAAKADGRIVEQSRRLRAERQPG